jgi:hypothetical protein
MRDGLGTTIEDVASIDARLASLLDDFDAHTVLPGDALGCWEAFDRIARRAEAAKVLLTEPVRLSGEWRRGGYKTPADHLAVKAGTTKAAAKRAERVAKELDKLSATAAAARRGELSAGQLEAIVDAASVNPASEQRLLVHARHASLRSIQQEATKARAAVEDRDATERRAHEERSYRSFTRLDGTFGASVQGTTAAGAEISQVIEMVTEQIFDEHRRAGSHEARDAYQFDALHRICVGYRDGHQSPVAGRRETPDRHLIKVRVDIEALNRGRTEGDELCEIEGLGPVPVTRVRELFGDAVVKLIFTKGGEVRNIVPAGRGWTAKQRMAVTWQDTTCWVTNCDNPRVQLDHVEPWTQGGPTEIANARPPCHDHHLLKTQGWAYYVEPDGNRTMIPPDDPRHPDQHNRPPPDR